MSVLRPLTVRKYKTSYLTSVAAAGCTTSPAAATAGVPRYLGAVLNGNCSFNYLYQLPASKQLSEKIYKSILFLRSVTVIIFIFIRHKGSKSIIKYRKLNSLTNN